MERGTRCWSRLHVFAAERSQTGPCGLSVDQSPEYKRSIVDPCFVRPVSHRKLTAGNREPISDLVTVSLRVGVVVREQYSSGLEWPFRLHLGWRCNS
jgi:hypothetical protein